MSWPYEKAFEYTIPNCEYEDIDELDDLSAEEIAELAKDLTCGQRWYWAAFFISLIWITILSYFMVRTALLVTAADQLLWFCLIRFIAVIQLFMSHTCHSTKYFSVAQLMNRSVCLNIHWNCV